MQGYAFGRPAPAATIEALLRDGLPLDRLALAFEPIADAPARRAAPRRAASPRPRPPPAAPPSRSARPPSRCGVSASTVRRWADTGRIAVVRTSGGHRRFPVAELRRLNGEAAARPEVARRRAARRRAARARTSCSASAAGELSAAVTRGLYDGPAHGWFGSVPGREQLGHWSARARRRQPRGTDYDGALDATRRLVTHADLAGASLLERHTFLERYGDAVGAHAAGARRAPRAELVGARRALRRLRQVTLEAADARAEPQPRRFAAASRARPSRGGRRRSRRRAAAPARGLVA